MNKQKKYRATDASVRDCSVPTMCGYSFGECANSLVMNGVNAFAMLYYTEALGLSPALAGIAMSIAVFWDALSDPIMGHISDNTRSRFGRRHPYMVVGGLLMALSFYFIWAVPGAVQESAKAVFWYLVVFNILLRTALTVFFVPYVALGFEMSTDYEGRSRMQGIRWGFNMAANLLGPAMAWSIFFRDRDGVRATDVPANFLNMGAAFAVATALLVLLVIFCTRRYAKASPEPATDGQHIMGTFFRDMKGVVLDSYARRVFAFVFLAAVNMVLVSSLQMYVYVYFMDFSSPQKSIAHGATMIGCGLGGLLSARLTHRFEKKGAVLCGGILSIAANALLALVFLTGVLPVETRLAVVVFVIFHALYWLGSGIMLPTATAMMADISELNKIRTGLLKDGAYSAVFSFIIKAAVSFSMLVSGYILSGIGFESDRSGELGPDVIWRLGAVMLLAGPVVCVAAIVVMRKYRVTRELIDEMRETKV
jgi:GPH family glycoside/pentoside/hexuronide:cation symporter